MEATNARTFDTAVVGAGLAGLIAANRLADAGRSVVVFDGLGASGGRARTSLLSDHLVNQGPHALYVDGHANRILQRFDIPVEGGEPLTRGTRGLYDDRLHLLPAGPVSLLRTTLLSPVEKLAVGSLLARLPRMDPDPLDEVTLAEWIDSVTRRQAVHDLLAALMRLATYVDCPELLSAGAALRQLSMALTGGVLYLHGGWQVLVDGLTARAEAAGVVFRFDGSVTGVLGDAPHLTIRTAVEDLSARTAIVAAGSPGTAERLTGVNRLVEAAGPPARSEEGGGATAAALRESKFLEAVEVWLLNHQIPCAEVGVIGEGHPRFCRDACDVVVVSGHGVAFPCRIQSNRGRAGQYAAGFVHVGECP